MHRFLPFSLIVLASISARGTDAATDEYSSLPGPHSEFAASIPVTAADCTAPRTRTLILAANSLEKWCADLVWSSKHQNFDAALAATVELLAVNQSVDESYVRVLSIRTEFIKELDESKRMAICSYLRMSSRLIELSGKLRYMLRDLTNSAAYHAARSEPRRRRLLDTLLEYRSREGATVMSVLLVDPPPQSGARPAPRDTKLKVLELIAATRQRDLLPQLVAAIEQTSAPPAYIVSVAEVIREVGLPQSPRPDDDSSGAPPITAQQLQRVLSSIDDAKLDSEYRQRRNALFSWLDSRIRRGSVENSFRVGPHELREGDWLLMRNPSPYNLFTDLSPGLFTHVGVVATEMGHDGIRRFVIVDLPERGSHIPAINVDQYLDRTLHYFFVRHRDPTVGRRMGQVALSMVGNEIEFDLTFRTDRVKALKGQSLKGKRINTYCAGFLILCAQETGMPLDNFFPIQEYPAPGNTMENLRKLGLSIGDHFVSPTGAIFSVDLNVVARQYPMYDPTREIKEAIYDHFAWSVQNRILTPAPSMYQALRLRVAEMSEDNPLLARLLARANDVSEHIDLVSAAKAAAVIETLDQIADENMNQFVKARFALLAGPPEALSQRGLKGDRRRQIARLRRKHSQLYQDLLQRKITPRDLRIKLVNGCVERGKEQLDERFFTSVKDAG